MSGVMLRNVIKKYGETQVIPASSSAPLAVANPPFCG